MDQSAGAGREDAGGRELPQESREASLASFANGSAVTWPDGAAFAGSGRAALRVLNGSESGSRALRRGQHLFWAGDAAAQIWVLESGSLKTYEISSGGNERVSGFYFAGQIVGWEALACGAFRSSAVALERSVIAPLPVAGLLDNALGSAQRQAMLLDGMREEFVRLQARLWLDQCTANERLAAFLLWIHERRLPDATRAEGFSLPMSRNDIGSYLGMASETVSRRLALFQRNGWITLQRRRITVRNVARLRQLCES